MNFKVQCACGVKSEITKGGFDVLEHHRCTAPQEIWTVTCPTCGETHLTGPDVGLPPGTHINPINPREAQAKIDRDMKNDTEWLLRHLHVN